MLSTGPHSLGLVLSLHSKQIVGDVKGPALRKPWQTGATHRVTTSMTCPQINVVRLAKHMVMENSIEYSSGKFRVEVRED
jgi:hypothetical protein